jgi:Tfp pilus assembly protein PilE
MTGDYKAYLLRLQRGQAQGHWRATLVDAHSGQEQHFATERALFIYLMRMLAEEPPPSIEENSDGFNKNKSDHR